jgi:hypothetical protein
MATTTTNFGWDIPQSTDLVKDGATAIAALGQDIDTAFVDFKGGTTGQVLKKTSNTDLDVEWGTASSGLTLINTTSFSGVSSQSLTASTFTSTYKNYKILISNVTSSVNNQKLRLRYRASGTDTTGNDYFRYGALTSSASLVTAFEQDTFFEIGSLSSTASNACFVDLELSNIYEATNTSVNFSGFRMGSPASIIAIGVIFNTTQYDSLTISPATGNMTGTISVFGYNA